MLPLFPDLLLYAPMWSVHVHYVRVNRSSAQRRGAPRGVSHATEAAEVIMLHGKAAPQRLPACRLDAAAPALSMPWAVVVVLRYPHSCIGVYS